jgi:hypothetical protein
MKIPRIRLTANRLEELKVKANSHCKQLKSRTLRIIEAVNKPEPKKILGFGTGPFATIRPKNQK